MDKDKNYIGLKQFCLDAGADLFGVADIKEIKNEFAFSARLLEKLDRAICLGMRLNDLVMEDIAEAPTRLYSYHYRTVNLLLDQIALKTTAYLDKKGYLALPVPASQVLDWQKHTAHLSHRKIAFLAGLGWIGRNNLLVNPEFGSRLRLVTILTDMPLETGAPIKENC
ncbi:MAG: reductive dehalogenase domain-containing protein, partial [Candidatus Omnitrophota bacterium]|nr:reductive dehalogenase domain-containing protein [Candidatus Omnitrophota bacterium]